MNGVRQSTKGVQLYQNCYLAYNHSQIAVDLVNLPCPKFADLAFFWICQILIYRSWSYVIGKLKTEVSCYHIDGDTPGGTSTWIISMSGPT